MPEKTGGESMNDQAVTADKIAPESKSQAKTFLEKWLGEVLSAKRKIVTDGNLGAYSKDYRELGELEVMISGKLGAASTELQLWGVKKRHTGGFPPMPAGGHAAQRETTPADFNHTIPPSVDDLNSKYADPTDPRD